MRLQALAVTVYPPVEGTSAVGRDGPGHSRGRNQEYAGVQRGSVVDPDHPRLAVARAWRTQIPRESVTNPSSVPSTNLPFWYLAQVTEARG